MYKILVFAVTSCLLQDTIACCCFREPYVSCCEPEVVSCDVITYNPCASPVCVTAAPCYETCYNPCPPAVYVPTAPCYEKCRTCSSKVYVPAPSCRNARPKSYGCIDDCATYKPCLTPPVCGYGASTSCYRDACCVCDREPSSVCCCLRSLDDGNCGCGCGCDKPCIYFPEVEYPVVACDIEPFYYNTCWCT